MLCTRDCFIIYVLPALDSMFHDFSSFHKGGKVMDKTKIENKIKKENSEAEPCTLCGQLYHNFAFKGGYICESCLRSIKDEKQEDPKSSEDT